MMQSQAVLPWSTAALMQQMQCCSKQETVSINGLIARGPQMVDLATAWKRAHEVCPLA